jgi:hypothetical protein
MKAYVGGNFTFRLPLITEANFDDDTKEADVLLQILLDDDLITRLLDQSLQDLVDFDYGRYWHHRLSFPIALYPWSTYEGVLNILWAKFDSIHTFIPVDSNESQGWGFNDDLSQGWNINDDGNNHGWGANQL